MEKQAPEHERPINEVAIMPKSQQLNQLILDNVQDLVAIYKLADLSCKYVNSAALRILGYSREEVFSRSFLENIHPDDLPEVIDMLKKTNLSLGEGNAELRYRKKDQSYAWLEVTGTLLRHEKEDTEMIVISRDITARKQAEIALQRQVHSQALLLEISKNFTHIMVDDIDDMINTTLRMIGEFDSNDRSYLCLISYEDYTVSNTHEWCAEGISAKMDNLQGLPVSIFPWWNHSLQSLEYLYIPRVADLPSEAQGEKELLQNQAIQSLIVVPMFLEDKILGFLGVDSVKSEKTWSQENIMILQSVAQTITKALQRRQFTQALQASENYYRAIFENTGAATLISDEDMSIAMVNDEYTNSLGYKREDLIGRKWTELVPASKLETMIEHHRSRRLHPDAAPRTYRTQIINHRGQSRDGLIYVDIIPGTNKSVATFLDLSEFNRINRALTTISTITATMIQAVNEEELIHTACQKIVEVSGYSLAWVGYVREDQQQKVQPVAHAGIDNAYLAKLNISLNDPKRGHGPTGTAIRTGRPVVLRDFKKDESFKPWLKDALRRGFKSCMAIPLLVDNKAFGTLGIYSNEIQVFDQDEQKLLADMANNMAYAIISLRTRIEVSETAHQLETSLDKMQRILMQAVTSLGTALDVRDPYTAGHQKEVARLATAIAEEMGFSPEQIKGIAVVGNLHDIGKIKIPSEILSRPGRLSDLEFDLIKTHCQAGYEIVKEIEFPWPVAEVLLQHHERMDGSGYPRGLVGKEIMAEARIMAVADVVETMASHRPYRPALGVDVALEEIAQNRGILYDPDVVDSCLRLFREKGFRLK